MCRGLRAAEASSHSSAGQKSEISMSAGLVLLEVLLRTVPHLLSASEGACVARGSCFGDASLQLGPPVFSRRVSLFSSYEASGRIGVRAHPGSSAGKESACSAGDPGSIPGLGRSAGEGTGHPLQEAWASLVAQLVENLPAVWETWV